MLIPGIKLARPPARVVILGATGFVPLALQQKFRSLGWPVLAVGSRDIDLTQAGAAAALAALLRSDDALIMTAALTPDKGRDVTTLIRNLRMAESVTAALTLRPCAHLIYFSSDAVYDARASVIDDTTAAAPTDLYGVMHLARELALAQTAAQLRLPFCVLRPCAIYGAGDTHNSYGPNRFLRTALVEGKIKLFGAGEETRDHVYIDDVVALTQSALEQVSTGVQDLVSGQSSSFAEVARTIVEMLQKNVAIEALPRSGPITHRAFAASRLSAFPTHRPTPLKMGVAKTIAALAASDA